MASRTPSRTPLMAGNWKMNLTHPEAVALVQKLAWILADKKHDFARTEVAVIPPFTDLRSVQTLVDGDRLAIRYGAQGRLDARLGCLHR
jgi:triosephosphate isomerase